MALDYVIGLVVSVGMLACLVLAMLKPEKFCFTRQRTWLDPVVRPVERLSTS